MDENKIEKKNGKRKKYKGIIMVYVNFLKDKEVDVPAFMAMIREMNNEWFRLLHEDGQYGVIIVPTINEATRVEKVDFDSPFPRFMPKNAELPMPNVLLGRNVDGEDEDFDDDDDEDEELDADETKD